MRKPTFSSWSAPANAIVRDSVMRYQKLIGKEPPPEVMPRLLAYVKDVLAHLTDNLKTYLFQLMS